MDHVMLNIKRAGADKNRLDLTHFDPFLKVYKIVFLFYFIAQWTDPPTCIIISYKNI